MTINLSTQVRQTQNQVSCKLDEEVAILNLQSTHYFGLDEVGAIIWHAIHEPVQVGQICMKIHEQYDIDAVKCQADVTEFLTRLINVGLAEIVPS